MVLQSKRSTLRAADARSTRDTGAGSREVQLSHVLTEEEVRIAAQALREFAEEEMQQ